VEAALAVSLAEHRRLHGDDTRLQAEDLVG
jgi:hypothetical protein